MLKAIDPTGAALDPGQQAAMAGFATLLGGGLAGLAGANAQGGATAAQNEVLNNTDNHTADAAKSGGLVSKVKTAINDAFTAYNDAQAQQALVESSVAQAVGTALAPKVAGGLQMSGGAGMAALGSNLVVGGLASCLETLGFGCLVAAGGGLLTFAGADNMVSGSTLALTGQYLPTLGSGLVGNALPVDQQTAEAIYGSLTAGLGGKLAPVAFTMPAGSPASNVGFDASNLESKLNGYLLDPAHAQNQTKANWFSQALGFNQSNWQDLASQLYVCDRLTTSTQ